MGFEMRKEGKYKKAEEFSKKMKEVQEEIQVVCQELLKYCFIKLKKK